MINYRVLVRFSSEFKLLHSYFWILILNYLPDHLLRV